MQMTEGKRTKDMLGRGGLIPVQEALDILLTHLATITLSTETIPLDEAFDRVLAEPTISQVNLPSEARSTMDGFAVRAADTFGASESMPCYLNITGEVTMGYAPSGRVQKGCCYKIPTGGLLPEGADGVVMLEQSIPIDDTVIEIVKSIGTGTNLMQIGEDITCGAEALPAGHLLRPGDVGLLAGLGFAQVEVYKKIRIGILATGDEIIHHSKTPTPGQIRNINSLALAGLVRRAGGVDIDYGIVSDRADIFLPALQKAVQECDLVLFSGGSSVGIRDLGEQVIEALGPPGILVHGVTLKPGKPIVIGQSGTTPIFGLPGHPVSALVCFDFFVQPAIKYLMGIRHAQPLPLPSVTAVLTRNINSAPGRRDVIRVRLGQDPSDSTVWCAEPILGKSGSISTLSRAHGFFLINEDCQGLTENSVIKVYLYT